MDAGAESARSIGITIISLTVSLIAVLIPLLFMGDVVGRLFREFAVTLAVHQSHLGGGIVTLTPYVGTHFAARAQGTTGAHYRWFRDVF